VAWFSAEDPKQPHVDAVKQLGHYLMATHDKGLVWWPTPESFDVYADVDFARNWNKDHQNTVTLLAQGTATSSCMPAALFTGLHSFRLKLP